MFLRITTYLPCVLALKYPRKRICIFLIEYNIFLILKISCDHVIEHVNKKKRYSKSNTRASRCPKNPKLLANSCVIVYLMCIYRPNLYTAK